VSPVAGTYVLRIRWKLVALFVLLVGSAIIRALYVHYSHPFAIAGSREHDASLSGLGYLGSVVEEMSLQRRPPMSFEDVLEEVRKHDPREAGSVNDKNPFPGILPNTRVYGRVLSLPEGLDRENVPLIWDTRPWPSCQLVVLFWDGHLVSASAGDVFTPEDLNQLLEVLRVKNNGASLDVLFWDAEGSPSNHVEKPLRTH
jgi:hypothetical protein